MEEGARAYGIALRALTRRDHSEMELRRKLSDKGISAAAVDEVVEKLKRSGYLDDRRFAVRWAESAVRSGRGYGFRLRYDLTMKGVAGDVVSEVLERLGEEFEEGETLKSLMQRKFPAFSPREGDGREKKRIMGYLQRRGFSVAAIIQMFRDMEGE